ncbi:hypothetical protein G9P44_005014 [Scheffersomyces stipitis]|nr:hypothetical protein G9P44_005014 [Scheffersomyces stipitis]
MSFETPTNFFHILGDKYNEAVSNSKIFFNGSSATNEVVHQLLGDSTVDFQYTLLHSLQHRPESGSIEKNPFAKPEPELTVLDSYGPNEEFKIVLNKFPVVAQHFMIVTKEFKSQDSPLSPSELQGTYIILQSLKASDKQNDWFAFYNCGPQSGASQPHKHIQFMSLPNKEDFVPFAEQLIMRSAAFLPNSQQEPLQNADIPFAHFVARLPEQHQLQEGELALYFASLLQRALTVSRRNEAEHISYNFICTTKYMMIVPRSNGKYKNSLGINSCGVLGLFLCKNEEILDLVKKDGPETILQHCGFPNTAGQGSDEYHY